MVDGMPAYTVYSTISHHIYDNIYMFTAHNSTTQVYLKAVAERLKRYNAAHGQTILKIQQNERNTKIYNK